MGKKITALKVQKKNRNRVNIYLDGEFAFGLSRIVAGWLHVGQELTTEKIAELQKEDEQEIAYQRAIRFSNYRMRSNSEIHNYLEQKGTSETTIENVLNRLNDNGFTNDEQFASMWVENRNEFRPRSHRMLFVELRKKGIQPEVINQVLEDTLPDDELALMAAQKQERKYRNLDWNDFRRRMSSYLSRRGFTYVLVNSVVNQVWEERSGENQPEKKEESRIREPENSERKIT